MIQRRDHCARQQPLAGFLWLGGAAIMASMSTSLKQKKLPENLVKHFLQFLTE
jgi:hypothetical protein